VTAAPDVSALKMLRQARDRIDRDYAEPTDIARAGGRGRVLSGAFHPRVPGGLRGDAGGYRTRRRVERACELLRSVNLSVTEICHMVGFTRNAAIFSPP